MKPLLLVLEPLLFANLVLWIAVAHQPAMAGVWALAMVASPYLLPDR